MKKIKQIHSRKSNLSPEQVIKFLDDFSKLVHSQDETTKAISLRVPQNILRIFKVLCEERNIPYQKQIVLLMREWCESK